MKKASMAVMFVTLAPACAFAADGNVLINQATVNATGGFPYKINQPGSYRLSGNLTVPDANTTAIQVLSDYVTLDLNGFGIIGPVTCTGGLPVTSCSASGQGSGVDGGSHRSITVLNGYVKGM